MKVDVKLNYILLIVNTYIFMESESGTEHINDIDLNDKDTHY